MTITLFDPAKFVNCKREQNAFDEILSFATSKRILTIQDGEGKGKSFLLQKLKHKCVASRTPIPAILLDFKEFDDYSIMSFVDKIVHGLEPWINFSRFKHANYSRLSGDWNAIAPQATQVAGRVDLRNSTIERGSELKVAGVMTNVEPTFIFPADLDKGAAEIFAEIFAQPKLTKDQEKVAQEVCIKGFLNDLSTYFRRRNKKAVIIIDSFERCNSSELENWIVSDFLKPYLFSRTRRNWNLGVIIAGHKTPAFTSSLDAEDCMAVITNYTGLSPWTLDDVEICLRAWGSEPDEQIIEGFHILMSKGVLNPLLSVTLIRNSIQPVQKL